MHKLCINQVTSSPGHPQSQGAIERFHHTLKEMVRAYSAQWPQDWDLAMPFLMFAVRDSVSEPLGFTPFKLVNGHEVRGPLRLLKERFVGVQCPTDPLRHWAVFSERLRTACALAQENLKGAKCQMKVRYDRKAQLRSFKVGNQVLVLLPGGVRSWWYHLRGRTPF